MNGQVNSKCDNENVSLLIVTFWKKCRKRKLFFAMIQKRYSYCIQISRTSTIAKEIVFLGRTVSTFPRFIRKSPLIQIVMSSGKRKRMTKSTELETRVRAPFLQVKAPISQTPHLISKQLNQQTIVQTDITFASKNEKW